MSAHTPGPWSVVDGHYSSFREIKGPSFSISIVMSAPNLDFMDYIKREADARLIAAAPELLEALGLMLRRFGGATDKTTPAELQAIAAIAKATGAQA